MAFRSKVVNNLGVAGANLHWNNRTQIPTLAGFAPIRAYAATPARLGLFIEPWLYNDGAAGPLNACQGNWRPAVAAIAFNFRARVP